MALLNSRSVSNYMHTVLLSYPEKKSFNEFKPPSTMKDISYTWT